jgi:hypothetical protein
MLTLNVNIDDAAARAGIAAVIRACEERAALHEVIAEAVKEQAVDHLTVLNSRSPNTSFYSRAAQSAETEVTGDGATIRFTHRGLALRYFGGRVLPKNVENLAIPTSAVPLAGQEGRKGPREAGILAWIPNRKGTPGTTGYLVEGIEINKKKGGTRIIRKPGGQLMYVLRSWTDHNKDESVLPSIASFTSTAVKAAEGFLKEIEVIS